MSMNLIFDVKGGSGCVDFPYQTQSSLTHSVLKAETKEKQLELIKNDIKDWDTDGTTFQQVKDLLYNPNLILTLI